MIPLDTQHAVRHVDLPDAIDPWRAAQTRKVHEGVLPLAALPRLRPLLAGANGDARFRMAFDVNEFGTPYIALSVRGNLVLTCQRSLENFELPVVIDQKLGLIADEKEEAALPEGYEPILVDGDELKPLDVIQDELILAIPAFPAKPGTEAPSELIWSTDVGRAVERRDDDEADGPPRKNPFEVLEKLKTK